MRFAVPQFALATLMLLASVARSQTFSLEADLQDDAPSTVVAATPAAGALVGAGNTSGSSVPGPGGDYPRSLSFDGADDYVSFPSVTASGNAVTYLALVNIPSVQNGSYTGILYCRRATPNICGLSFFGVANTRRLGYTWANQPATYSWDSGIDVPLNQWCLVALAVEPTQATLYCISDDGVLSSVNAVNHGAVSYLQTPRIGWDGSGVGERYLQGKVCGAKIAGSTLSQTQLQAMFDAATASLPAVSKIIQLAE